MRSTLYPAAVKLGDACPPQWRVDGVVPNTAAPSRPRLGFRLPRVTRPLRPVATRRI
jgi:hypothetical protein